MKNEIKDVVWITGASSGIGRALALRMARAGYRVAATARRQDALEALAREAEGQVLPVAADTTDAASLAAAVTRIETQLGPIGIAVFCAGTYQALMGAELTAAKARPLFELNFMGTVNALEAVLPGMIRRRKGRVAMVASLAGYFGLPPPARSGAQRHRRADRQSGFRPDAADRQERISDAVPDGKRRRRRGLLSRAALEPVRDHLSAALFPDPAAAADAALSSFTRADPPDRTEGQADDRRALRQPGFLISA